MDARQPFFAALYVTFWLLVLTGTIAGCGRKSNELRVEHKNFAEEIQQEQNLVFTFNKALVPEARLQQWDTVPYLNITPAVKGRFKWTAPNELVFSPLQPFAPSTHFRAELTPALLRHSPQPYKIAPDQVFRFHTPYLNLTAASAYWARSDNQASKLEARLGLVFNYPVPFAALRQYLHVYQGAKEVPVELVTANGKNLAVKLKNLVDSNRDATPIRVDIAPGLTTSGSTYRTKQPIEQKILLPSRQYLQITAVTASVVEGQEQIFVATTQPVRMENLYDQLKIEPRVSFSLAEQEGGFVLKGAIPQANAYTLTISKNLTGLEGAKLGKDYTHAISFAAVRPGIAFVNRKSIYLSSQGARNIALNVVGVPRLKVSIGRVYENNILRVLRDGRHYQGHYDEQADEYNEWSYYPVDETNGNIIFERMYDLKSLQQQGNAYLLNLSLNDLDFDSEFKGLYVLTVTSPDKKWLGDSKIISVSDIGLIARQGHHEVTVFANAIREAKVLPGVEVRFISTNNQVMHTATTDQDGVARFTDKDKTAPDFKVGLITARLGPDFTYLPYSQTQVNTSRFEVGGKRLNNIPYDAFIYGDRNLYRPGDLVHVNTVVRTPAWETVAGLPIKIKMLLPTGKEFRSLKGKLNAQGACEFAFALPPTTVTGTYTLEVYSGNDVLLNSSQIGVEEFMPDRLKVTPTLNKTIFTVPDSLVTKFTAYNFFGPPAGGRNYELQLSLQKKVFEPKDYPDYTFDVVTADAVTIQNSVRQGQTNAQGQGQEIFALTGYQDIGLLEGTLYTTVFDEAGRPVNRLSKFAVSTQAAYFGIKKPAAYVPTRAAMRILLRAVNQQGKPTAAPARVQLVRFTYESVIERSAERYGYKSQRKENIISSKIINIPAGGVPFNFTPVASGEYEIRVMRPGAFNYVAQKFYAYGWGDTESTSFEVNNEGEVTISLDKATYNVGDKANILFKAPFAGKILVTVERDKVLHYYYLQTDKKAASLTLPIQADYLPTVYITATALRQIKDNTLPLTVARGFVPLMVTRKDTQLPVTIIAPAVSRSQRVQPVSIRTAPNAEVTLAVVDEGILQLKDYATPDPHGYFYQKRALEVNAYDLYPYLFPELTGRRSSVGGDGFDLARRINPLTSKRVKLVAVWSGHLKANSQGDAKVNVNIPEFSGALRIMAVAYKNNAFGSADKTLRVTDPVVISTALPRFVGPQDTLLVPVTLSNTTAKNTVASSTITTTGPLRVVGTASKTATLNSNSEAQVIYKLVAGSGIGQATVTVGVQALNEKFSSHTNIPVRPIAPLVQLTGAGTVKDGASITLAPTHDFLPASVTSRLVLSRSPVAQFTDDITFLLQYPHGCLEQTVSRAFPLLYYLDLAKSLQPKQNTRAYNPNYLVQEAILKVEALQQYNGGFTYWPGGTDTDWWTSAYAAHFLLEARQAGYAVNKTVLDKALTYLQRQVKTKGLEEYRFYNASRQVQSKFIAAHENTYSLYVLNLARQPDWATMNYYKAKTDLLSLDARYVLASTYALSGNRESFNQLLPRSFTGESALRALDGSFYSVVRDMALSLNSLLEADPDNPQIGTLARHLSQELSSSRWYNTQERAFALMALGKMARRSQGNLTARIIRNGKKLGAFAEKDFSLENTLNSGQVTIQTSGKGTLYYFWEVAGISRSGNFKSEDNFLRVRKTYFDRSGREIKNHTVKQNDLVVVRIALQSLGGRTVPNVAITDMLPAGFEIENPRLLTERAFNWLNDQKPARPDYTDMRDDRINLYATARTKPQYFYYQVRAVTQGHFQLGPVGADAMYNAEYHSYSGGGVMRVK